MPAVDEVAAICLLAVDGEPHTGQHLHDAFRHVQRCGVIAFRRTIVRRAGDWQDRDEHCHRAIDIQKTHD